MATACVCHETKGTKEGPGWGWGCDRDGTIANNDTTEEHHSDGKLMGHSQFVPAWISTRQTPAS